MAATPLNRAQTLKHDLWSLWVTRKTSGFPWPFQDRSPRVLLLGYGPFTVIPLWKQVLTIPLRPFRYARMVRNIAKARGRNFHPEMYDDVP